MGWTDVEQEEKPQGINRGGQYVPTNRDCQLKFDIEVKENHVVKQAYPHEEQNQQEVTNDTELKRWIDSMIQNPENQLIFCK